MEKKLPHKLVPQMEVLGEFPPNVQDQVADLAKRREYKKGDILFHAGQIWPFVFYVYDGMLRSVISSLDAQEYTVSTWGEGEVFWSHSLLDGEPMPSTMEALKEATVYLWPGELMMDFLLAHPPAARALLRRQTQLIRARRSTIHNLAFSSVTGRLAKFILKSFDSTRSNTISRELTLDEMASIVSTSPVVVCRVLHQLQAEGVLKISRSTISLSDWNALERIAQEGEKLHELTDTPD
ncbi:MAG: Crp/Fnr family transcriptional regulator [Anaerolineales bacterium]